MTEFLGVGWQFPVMKPKKEDVSFPLAKYEESIEQAIRIILSTSKGERVMRPDFGCNLHELVFAPNNASNRGLAEHYVREALLNWEPRIKVLEVEASVAGAQEEAIILTISYRVRATDNRFNLVYPFYLERGRP